MIMKRLFKKGRISRRQFLSNAIKKAFFAATYGLFGTSKKIYAVGYQNPTADTILKNGKIITIDAKDTIAQAVAIKNGKILAVGTNPHMDAHHGTETRIINLNGKTVTPGLIDSHAHLPYFGERDSGHWLNLQGLQSKEAIFDALSEKATKTPKGQWVYPWGVESNALNFLDREDLDRISTNHPMIVLYTGGQWGFANSLALKIAGITKDTPSLPGSKIDKSFFGNEPTGLLIHYPALNMVRSHIPPPTNDKAKEILLFSARKYAKEGVTTVHDNFVHFGTPYYIRAYFYLTANGKLPIRMKIFPYIPSLPFAMLIVQTLFPENKLLSNQHIERLFHKFARVYHAGNAEKTLHIFQSGLPFCKENHPKIFDQIFGGFKLAVDGGGPTGLWYRNPYGMALHSRDALSKMFSLFHGLNFQVTTHAIGDEAVDLLLDACEHALEKVPRKDHRHRIEHALCPQMDSRERMKNLGMVLSTHPQWIMAWGDKMTRLEMYERSWSQGKTVFPLRRFMKLGIPLAFGADPPAYPIYHPQLALYEATSRITKTGYQFDTDEKIAIKEALRIQTMGGAYAAFEEDIKGSIEKGKLADLVVWDQDFYTIPNDNIKNAKVLLTMMDGNVVYHARN
ncbi:MAG: amidohydrolase [Deltaproteobacteria bacterium]|nr:amidohydrolase [Deltaproteobacteria bacterium]